MAVAVIGVVVALMLAGIMLAGALAARQRVIGAADAAALAAADAASGAVAGSPCALAQRVAAANGARLAACSIDGLVASVTVSWRVGLLPISARSTAGPPP